MILLLATVAVADLVGRFRHPPESVLRTVTS
jgi:hypothetical protein